MAMYTVEYIKSRITPQRFIAGFDVARLFNMEHVVFHNRLYDYYRNNGNPTNQPTIYRQDRDGYFLATSASFPYDITAMRVDLSEPTFGITSKHLLDLYLVFGEKREEIEILIQALMNVIMVNKGNSADAYMGAKQCIGNKKDFIYDFEEVFDLSEEDAEELFGKILIQDEFPRVKYRNLETPKFDIIREGINRQFIKKHPYGINRGAIQEILPVIEDDDKFLWREIKI